MIDEEYDEEVRRYIEAEYRETLYNNNRGVDLSNTLFIDIKKINEEKRNDFSDDASTINALRDAIVRVILRYWRSGDLTSVCCGSLIYYAYDIAHEEYNRNCLFDKL
jgi:hypothetical protein